MLKYFQWTLMYCSAILGNFEDPYEKKQHSIVDSQNFR